jgi:hypothetical protein
MSTCGPLKRKILWDNPGKDNYAPPPQAVATEVVPTSPPVNLAQTLISNFGIFFYPNRPTLMPPSKELITTLEKSGKYVAEQKWNGDNVLYNTDSQRFWNRHKELHRYLPSPEVKKELDQFPKGCLINAELVNYRTKTIKELIIVHSILVYQGSPLLGKTWDDARKIIEEFKYGEHVTLSKIYTSGFWDLFNKADGAIVEGIILKDPTGRLVFSTTAIKDVNFMKKFRKPREGVYSF